MKTEVLQSIDDADVPGILKTAFKERDAVIAKQERDLVQPIIDAAQEFVERCERGEIHSKYTYAKIKEALLNLQEEDRKRKNGEKK